MNRSSPADQHCDCGSRVEPCHACAAPRCARCEPYVSDDCTAGFAQVG